MYHYDVQISTSSALLEHLRQQVIPGCAYIILKSTTFTSLQECERNLVALLGSMAAVLSGIDPKNYVVVRQNVPDAISLSTTEVTAIGDWDASTVSRLFVSDAEELKKSQLKFSVVGRLKTCAAPASN